MNVPAEILNRDDLINLVKQTSSKFRSDKIGLGRAPASADMVRRVTYENIARALAFLRDSIRTPPAKKVELPPDVDDKIAFNLLPVSVRSFLLVGLTAADRVRRYLQDQAAPNEAEKMAEGFSSRYREVRDKGAEPTEAFGQMLAFAGGATLDPDRDAAALAIVTHFFTTCEIFERPPQAGGL